MWCVRQLLRLIHGYPQVSLGMHVTTYMMAAKAGEVQHQGCRMVGNGVKRGHLLCGSLAALSAHGVSGWKGERQIHGQAETLVGR